MATTIVIDGVTREYKNSEMNRYSDRLKKPGTKVGAVNVAASTNLTEACESHIIKSQSAAGTGKRASQTLRDVVYRSDGTMGEVTIVQNVYHDDTHPEDLDRAGLLISAGAQHLTANSNAVLKEMTDLGVVDI